jgi:hypothetical protein
VGVYEREGIQLPHVAPVAECAEVAPVDFESFSGQRFHADRFPAHVEMPLDLADGPVLGPVEPVQIVDLFGGQHG